MRVLENKRKTQYVFIQKSAIGETVEYDEYESDYQYQIQEQEQEQQETRELHMFSILNSIFRKALRKPFQNIVIRYHEPDSEASIEINYKHSLFELQIIEENIRSVSTLYRQKLLVDGFLTIKTLYERKLRVQEAYYNEQNIKRLQEEIVTFAKREVKYQQWMAFGRLYENYRGMKLSKITLSKIDMISNDYTSRQLQDFQPLFISGGKDIEVIHSYIIDKSNSSSNNDEENLEQNMDYKFQKINDIKLINPVPSIQKIKLNKFNNNHLHQANMSKKVDFLKSEEMKKRAYHEDNGNTQRAVKKFSSSYKEKGTSDRSNVMVTERKEGLKYETGTTDNKVLEYEPTQSQHIYLIRDYRTKKKEPANYVKIPVLTDNIKIVQIHTDRRKSSQHKTTRIIKQSFQIQQSICQNCKYCKLNRERKQIMKSVTQRIEYNNHSEAVRVEYGNK